MLRPPSPSFHMHEKELTTSTSSRACTQVQPHLRASWAALITRNMMAPPFCVSDELNCINGIHKIILWQRVDHYAQ